jgi:hypothetical protein
LSIEHRRDTPSPAQGGDVAELYRLYIFQQHKPPTKVADFNAMEMMSPIGLRALKSGEVVAYLKADLPDLGEEPGKGLVRSCSPTRRRCQRRAARS